MRSGLEILAAGLGGGALGATVAVLRHARGCGIGLHRGTDATAGFVFGSVSGLVFGAFVLV